MLATIREGWQQSSVDRCYLFIGLENEHRFLLTYDEYLEIYDNPQTRPLVRQLTDSKKTPFTVSWHSSFKNTFKLALAGTDKALLEPYDAPICDMFPDLKEAAANMDDTDYLEIYLYDITNGQQLEDLLAAR